MNPAESSRDAALRFCAESEIHVEQRRYEAAIGCLRQALQIDPWLHSAHRRIWHLYGRSGKLEAAIKAFRIALATRFRHEPAPAPSKNLRRLDRTTLCAVDCLHPELTIPALLRSMSSCAFDAIKLLTDKNVSAQGIEVVPIPPITSLQEYSRFLVKELVHYINTDHVLLIQWDGFICGPEHWEESFLLYDYIGARWPPELMTDHPEHAVGNGGFSLRSRALLEALQDPKIASIHPEDAIICRSYRPYLEQRYDIAFADDVTADRFSSEHCALDQPTFGFHGIINLSRHLPWPEFQRFEFFE